MDRIAVVGCIGAGKSTVARALGRALGIEVFHLDRYWWKPGRYRVIGPETVATNTMDLDEFRRLEEQIVAGTDGSSTAMPPTRTSVSPEPAPWSSWTCPGGAASWALCSAT